MQFRLYQMNVAAGAACAVLLGVLRHGASSSSDTSLLRALEAASFGLCMIGIFVGGRSVRTRFEEFGSDKAAATSNPSYMRERRDLQVTAIVAAAAVASLAASRYGMNPLYSGLSVLTGGAVLCIFIGPVTYFFLT